MARPRPRVAAWCPGFREAWAAMGRAGKLPPGRRGHRERGRSLSKILAHPCTSGGPTRGSNPACVRQRPGAGDQGEPQARLLGSGPSGQCRSVGGGRGLAGARAGVPLPACARLCGVQLALEAPGTGLCLESGSLEGGAWPGTSQGGWPGTSWQAAAPTRHVATSRHGRPPWAIRAQGAPRQARLRTRSFRRSRAFPAHGRHAGGSLRLRGSP